MDALVPDDLWAVVEPLRPPEAEEPKGGRPPASDRAALAGIILVLRTGMQWKHLPRPEIGCSGKTSWRRLGAWQTAGVWAALREQGERHSRKRIAQLTRKAGLVGASHRRGGTERYAPLPTSSIAISPPPRTGSG